MDSCKAITITRKSWKSSRSQQHHHRKVPLPCSLGSYLPTFSRQEKLLIFKRKLILDNIILKYWLGILLDEWNIKLQFGKPHHFDFIVSINNSDSTIFLVFVKWCFSLFFLYLISSLPYIVFISEPNVCFDDVCLVFQGMLWILSENLSEVDKLNF